MVTELAQHNLTTDEFAAAILKKEKGFQLVAKPRATYVDPAGNSVNSHTSESEVKVLRRHGISCRSKSSGVREGCVLLMDALADPKLPLVGPAPATGRSRRSRACPPIRISRSATMRGVRTNISSMRCATSP